MKKWDASSLQKIVVAEVLSTTFVLTLFYKPMHVLVNSSEIFEKSICITLGDFCMMPA